jgi:hypothetical protein
VENLARGRVSFGIPINRTSADLGTAFDIADKNKTDPQKHDRGNGWPLPWPARNQRDGH